MTSLTKKISNINCYSTVVIANVQYDNINFPMIKKSIIANELQPSYNFNLLILMVEPPRLSFVNSKTIQCLNKMCIHI